MGVYIKGMEMPKSCLNCFLSRSGCRAVLKRMRAMEAGTWIPANYRHDDCPLVPIPPHGDLIKRIVYRGEVYNALESARINALDGILTDRYKDGFHDGLKKALEILANEVKDAPTIIPASEEGE